MKLTRKKAIELTIELWELLDKAAKEAGNVNIADFPAQGQKCQSLIDQALALLKQQPKDYPTRTIENTYICPCGNIFVEDDDYDTAGSESGVCCPDCGNEKFQTVKDLLKQQPPAE